METLLDLHDAILSIEWFTEVGNDYYNNGSSTRASNFNEALGYWRSPKFAEARSVAWEAFRSVVCKDEVLKKQWITEFDTVNQMILESINRSQKARSFIACTDDSIENFCRDLPFVGAAGEIIMKGKSLNYSFFTSQITHFLKGHWVCGWQGELNQDYFEYPSINFYIF